MLTNKEQYRLLCETEGSRIPLFQQYWWMDAVCYDKQWDVALAYTQDGDIAAAMPYLIGRRWGMRFVVPPQLTPFNGPWYNYSLCGQAGKPYTEYQRIEFEQRYSEPLIEAIDRLHLAVFVQCFPYTVTNWLPFYNAGFKQTTRYTYRFEDITDLDSVMASFIKVRRKKIAKWDALTSLELYNDVDVYIDRYFEYWQHRGRKALHSRDFLRHVLRTAIDRGAGVIMALIDAEGRAVDYAFVVYDSNCAYLMQTVGDYRYYQNSHRELLYWKMFKWFSQRTRSFDFEGSMERGNEYFKRSFGAHQVPYFRIERYRPSLLREVIGLS